MILYNSGIVSPYCDETNINGIEICANVPFSKLCTYGCGGTAKFVLYPKNFLQAKRAYNFLKNKNYFVLGNGSNVLASDGVFDGYILSTKKLKGIVRLSYCELFCFAGTTVGELLNYCKIRGLSGVEYLAGIPASIGGIAFMNAGIANHYVQDSVAKVMLYNGKNVVLSNKRCNFSYKYSTMRDINGIILGVLLKLEKKSPEFVERTISEFLQRRRRLPKGKSCGCVFKNYNGISAGKIIEDAGLKGTRLGTAQISEEHANFIISNGKNSRDVRALIDYAKREVQKKFNISLQEEVVYIGEFNDFNG